ncbi:HPP family protein [Leptospira idonii]|uniref:HPP family protein n=1 Tax=Leptospira idonii TaxID=1193500 RepID=A0A4R9LXV2_9LEPT|nr:HPP family protein [Leptospira idonii]
MIGSCISIWSILAITELFGHQLLIGSFGASVVLLFSAPDSALAQPRNLVGGHLISAITAVVIYAAFGSSFLMIGLAVGISILLMYLTHTIHPPGGATAIIGVMGQAGPDFIIFPVLTGALILLLNALLINNFVHHRKYPNVWF